MIRNFCQAVLRRVFQFFQEFFYFPVFCPERSFFCRILPCRCGNIVRTRVRLRPKSQPCPLPCRSVRESAYLRRHPLSDLRFCLSPLPLYPLPVRSAGLLLLPLPMARERCASLLSPPPSDKGGGGGAPPLSIPPLMVRSAEPPHALPPLLVSSSTLPFMPPLMVRGGVTK